MAYQSKAIFLPAVINMKEYFVNLFNAWFIVTKWYIQLRQSYLRFNNKNVSTPR